MDNAPVEPKGAIDKHGRAVKHPKSYAFAPSLADPTGGTNALGGRFTIKMTEPKLPEGAPSMVVQNVSHWLELMDTGMCLYGHPDILRVMSFYSFDSFDAIIHFLLLVCKF